MLKCMQLDFKTPEERIDLAESRVERSWEGEKMPAEPSNDYRVVVFGAGGHLSYFIFAPFPTQHPSLTFWDNLSRCWEDQPCAKVHPWHFPRLLCANNRGHLQEGDLVEDPELAAGSLHAPHHRHHRQPPVSRHAETLHIKGSVSNFFFTEFEFLHKNSNICFLQYCSCTIVLSSSSHWG